VHLLFNLTGTVMIYPVRAVRRIPIRAAHWFAGLATRSRGLAIGYVLTVFYGVPAFFAFLNQLLSR